MSKFSLTKDYMIYLLDSLPYERVSSDGELNYRLRVMYNKNNLVPNQVLISGPSPSFADFSVQNCKVHPDESRSI
ncbi:MAG: hypothetical protein ACKPKO_30395 [Candidatus Fonsibacter sp.]